MKRESFFWMEDFLLIVHVFSFNSNKEGKSKLTLFYFAEWSWLVLGRIGRELQY